MLNFLKNIQLRWRKRKFLEIDHLIFGRFSSDNYSYFYPIFKLTKDKLYIDDSSTWHNVRHGKGYTFVGRKLPDKYFNIAKDLLYACPYTLKDKKLKSFYTTGNKNEDNLVIEISNRSFKKQITINDYETPTEKLPEDLKQFRMLAEQILRQLNHLMINK